jgi:cytochrome c oxidase subunit 2
MNDFMRRILFLPPQASTVAPAIDHLHYFVITTTMLGALLITATGFWMVIRFRRRDEHEPEREQPAPKVPAWLEGTVIASLLGLFCLWWLIGFLQFVRMRVAPTDTLDIYVTAKQWMWRFSYADGHHSLSSVFVPAGRPVKLVMISRDVIHSFFVPDFRVKQDVIPGRQTTLWFQADHAGVHEILCAEYCGTGHSRMRGEVVVLEPADYERWLESAGPQPELADQGRRAAAEHGCLRCHTLDGTPHIGPSWRGLYHATIPLQDGSTAFVDEAFITESMMDPRAKIHSGFQPVMPSFLGQIAPAETAAIIALIRSLENAP